MHIFLTLFCLITTFLTAQPQVFDCFLYLNEIEILMIRLHEMDPVVDKFIIVESSETFSGKPKPYNLEANWDRLEPFEDKILYVKVGAHFETSNNWDRETFQRNQILAGLTGCKPDDIILISDVDEIVRAKGVADICSTLAKHPLQYVGVNHEYHSNFLNSPPSTQPWYGTVATTYAGLLRKSPQQLRDLKDHVSHIATGWHFTWQGGGAANAYKMTSYAHANEHTAEQISAAMQADHTKSQVVPIDDTFPRYVIENQDYLEKVGYILLPK